MASKIVIIASIVVGVVVASITAALMVPSQEAPATTTNEKSAATQSVEQITTELLSPSIAGAPALGSDDAKVTIVEFGDYQCTWCHRWHEGTKDTLVADYVNTGKVRFLFKDFPINDLSDRASSLAAEASYCAADQGKYWQYHDKVYSSWQGENTGWVTRTSLEQFAKDVDVRDIPAFSDCLDSGKYSSVVKDNYYLQRSIGLDATPSFIFLIQGEFFFNDTATTEIYTFEKVINGAYAS